jgi:uncharacterized iron-regulated membrane protein
MEDVLAIALSGLTVVLGSMLLLTGCCALLRRVARRAAPQAPDSAAEDPALIAVIAAAAAEALGSRVVIHRVRLLARPDAERWSRAGRMDIMSSHRVGPRR